MTPNPVTAATAAVSHHLDALESEAIHILREVAGQCRVPALLFSGGKDSLVLLRLAEKAFRPAGFPFPLLHVDTGHNFPEVIAHRDATARRLGERLIVASVEESIARGDVADPGPLGSRNALQSVTLLSAVAEHGFDALIGGARRDEEKARAKERVFSHRDGFGQWQPRRQRAELWNLYNGKVAPGEHLRVFPDLELDRTRRVALHRPRTHRPAVDLLRASGAIACAEAGKWLAVTPVTPAARRRDGRTRGRPLPDGRRHDLHLPGRVAGAATVEQVVAETLVARDQRAGRDPAR